MFILNIATEILSVHGRGRAWSLVQKLADVETKYPNANAEKLPLVSVPLANRGRR
jgi:hypothetical protein